MWIVRLALRQPYTFVVAALLILLLGVVTICRMAVDIFPEINIPVVSVIWQYNGVAPEEMEQRIVTEVKEGSPLLQGWEELQRMTALVDILLIGYIYCFLSNVRISSRTTSD